MAEGRSSYAYPIPNSRLIETFGLEKHFEGGYFSQRASLESHASSSAAQPRSAALKGRELSSWGVDLPRLGGPAGEPEHAGDEKRIEANSIYYLLTSDSYRGKMHMNLHAVSFGTAGSSRRTAYSNSISIAYMPVVPCTRSSGPQGQLVRSPWSGRTFSDSMSARARRLSSSSLVDGGRRQRFQRKTCREQRTSRAKSMLDA